MSREDHPAFRNKDASNRKAQRDRIERQIRELEQAAAQVEYDLKFAIIINEGWYGNQV